MAQTRKIVEDYLNAWRSGDEDRLRQIVSEDAEIVNPVPGTEGRDGDIELSRMVRQGFPDMTMDLDHWVEADERVAARFRFRGTHEGEYLGISPTGRKVEVDGVILCDVRDGKVVYQAAEIDSLGMLDQLGALPEQVTVS